MMSTPGIELPNSCSAGKRSPHCAMYAPDIYRGTFSYLIRYSRLKCPKTPVQWLTATLIYLQRSFFVCSILFICSIHLLFTTLIFICSVLFLFTAYFFYLQRNFLFAAYFFYLQRFFFVCSILFLFAAYFFYLQRSFFVCSVSFLFAAFLFCLQRFFFVCSVSFLFAACPLWAIVRSDGVKSCHHYNFEKNINIFSKLKREGNTLELPSPFGRVRAHDFFFFYLQRSFFVCSVRFLFAAFRLFAVGIFYLQCSFLFAAYFFYLQRTFFICSVPFLFAAFLFCLQRFFFCLQRFFFACSVSFLFAVCPLWAIVESGHSCSSRILKSFKLIDAFGEFNT